MRNSFLKSYWWLSIPIIVFIGIYKMIDFHGLYGQDSYEYARYTECLTNYIQTGQQPGDYFWPINYPLFASFLNLMMPVALACQLVSFLSFIGICILLKKIIHITVPSRSSSESSIYLITAVIFSPYFFRGSILCMSDLLAAFFITAAIYFFLMIKDKPSYLIWLTVAAGISICTRYAGIVILLPLCAIAYYKTILQNKNYLIACIAILAGIVTLIPQYLLKTDATSAFVSHEWVSSWSVSNFFSFEFATNEGTAINNAFNLMYVFSVFFHPGYLLAGIPLLIGIRKEHFKGVHLLLILTILAYLIFLAGIPFQNIRFLMIVFPLVIIFMAQPFYVITKKYSKKIILLAATGLILMQIAVFTYSFGKVVYRSSIEQEMANFFLGADQNKYIYGYSFDVPLPYYGVKQPIKNMFMVRYETFEKGSYVLFNPEELKNKLEGRNPNLNWEKMNKENSLIVIKEFKNGWKVYEIR